MSVLQHALGVWVSLKTVCYTSVSAHVSVRAGPDQKTSDGRGSMGFGGFRDRDRSDWGIGRGGGVPFIIGFDND